MSRSALAAAIGVDRSLVHRIENGERRPSPLLVRRMADALQCPLMALLGPTDGEAA